MKRILSLCIVIIFTLSTNLPIFALSMVNPVSVKPVFPIYYPAGEDFERLKVLIDESFSPMIGYAYNCIAEGTLCPNYKYTSIVEKAIKFIVLKTYTGNEEFYAKLFGEVGGYNNTSANESDFFLDNFDVGVSEVDFFLEKIPRGVSLSDWRAFDFGQSIGSNLLGASFDVNFTENNSSNSMLSVIENKISELKRAKCQRDSQGNSDCYSNNLSNKYIPTKEELFSESIFLNRMVLKIGELKDDIDYIVTYSSGLNLKPQEIVTSDSIIALIPQESVNYYSISKKLLLIGLMSDMSDKELIVRSVLKLIETDISITVSNKQEIKNKLLSLISGTSKKNQESDSVAQSYILKYAKTSYTLEEAKREIEKRQSALGETVFTRSNRGATLGCISRAKVLKECDIANALILDISTALGAYYSDKEKYPDSIDQLDSGYLDAKVLPVFKEYFTYKNISTSSLPDFEIRYIGHIGEGPSESEDKSIKKDYTALMSGATVPPIPLIFSHVPRESMVLYVKNPANLIEILNQKSNTSQRLSGFDVSESIKDFILTFFELKNFEQIQNNLKSEMAIVVNNLDATAPDIVLIMSESDRGALAPTAKARIVESKDGLIYMANSRASIDRLISLSPEKSLRDASDFHYVWWKKSAMIRDAFMFVGDAFFENLLTFETYISHYRKYRDYSRLSNMQELVWAYSDAFGKNPKSLDELTASGYTLLAPEILSDYSITDGLVTHKNIGALVSVKTINDSKYDFSKITRSEIDDYKSNVQGYRDIWQSSLDPMGIVMNRYRDGIEMDFIMTPIPTSPDLNLQEIQKMFEGVTKDSLSFITNPHIRMGLASFIWGFDAKKVQQKIQASSEYKQYFDMFSKQVLGGKDIFDYLAGEFAFSIGNLDPDMLDGWNIDKIDVYGSVQVTSEEKGKELIDSIRSRILAELGSAGGDEVEMIKGFLAKPLIEDYNGKKIYYVEGLQIPFVGKIGFAYTFVDDFFIIGLNRGTIKNVIDTVKSGDANKKKLIEENSFGKGTFFATLFDGVTASTKLKSLYEKNKTSIPRYMQYLTMANIGDNSSVASLLGTYYVTQDRNKRLSQQTEPFSYTLGSLSIISNTDNIIVKIDENKLKSLSGVTLQMWENIKGESDFPAKLLDSSGMPLELFLARSNLGELLSLNIILQVDNAFSMDESLLRNVTFGLNMGDDEIGFHVRMFRKSPATSSQGGLAMSQEVIMIIAIGGIIMLLGGIGGFVVYRRRRNPLGADSQNSGGGFYGATASPIDTPMPTPPMIPIIVPAAVTPVIDTLIIAESITPPVSNPESPIIVTPDVESIALPELKEDESIIVPTTEDIIVPVVELVPELPSTPPVIATSPETILLTPSSNTSL